MQVAFCDALSLHHVGFCRPVALTRFGPGPKCCASRPPQDGTATKVRVPKKTRLRRRASPPLKSKREMTAAELSTLVSQKLGFDIIKSDWERFTTFLRSFVRVRTVTTAEYSSESQHIERENQLSSNESAIRPSSEPFPFQESAIVGDSHPFTARRDGQFKPRSKIGRAVAVKYNHVRGTFDRTCEGVSLATEALFLSILARAGTVMYFVLEASEKVFPGLNIGSVKRVAEHMVNSGWSPLKTFEWQTAASSDLQLLRDNRRSRIAYVKQYLRGNPGGAYTRPLSVISSGVSSMFYVYETTTPVLFRGASKAISASLKTIRAFNQGARNGKRNTSPETQESLSRAIPWTVAGRGEFAPFAEERATKHASGSWISNKLSHQLDSKFVLPRNPNVPKRMRSAIPVKEKTQETSGTRPSRAQNGWTEHDMLETGGAVLGGGLLMMAVSGVSLPISMTCSAVFITMIGVTQARAGEMKGEIYQTAREAFRRSKSVRKLDNIIAQNKIALAQGQNSETNLSKASFTAEYEVLSVSNSSAQRARRRELVTKPLEIGLEDIAVVDVEALSVSRPEPSILSTPILGQFLSNTDEVAFALEKLSDLLSYRLRPVLGARTKGNSWILLKSFLEHVSDDS